MIRKIIRKSVTGLAAVIIALCMVVLSVAAGASEATSGANTEPVNVILIIDKSGSMRRTDQEGQAKSAASEFLDILLYLRKYPALLLSRMMQAGIT